MKKKFFIKFSIILIVFTIIFIYPTFKCNSYIEIENYSNLLTFKKNYSIKFIFNRCRKFSNEENDINFINNNFINYNQTNGGDLFTENNNKKNDNSKKSLTIFVNYDEKFVALHGRNIPNLTFNSDEFSLLELKDEFNNLLVRIKIQQSYSWTNFNHGEFILTYCKIALSEVLKHNKTYSLYKVNPGVKNYKGLELIKTIK